MKKWYLLAGVACLAMASCSKEDSTPVNTVKNELGITAAVVQGGNATRSLVSGTAFTSGTSVKVFMTNTTGTSYDGTIGTYTYDGTSWTNSAHSIILGSDVGTVYAYAPSTAVLSASAAKGTATSTLDISLPATENSFTGAGQTDYLYGTGAKDVNGNNTLVTASNVTGSNSASLYFHHALSKISFIVNNWGYLGVGNLSKITLSTGGTTPPADFNSGSGTMKVADGTLTWSGAKVSALNFNAASTTTINSSSTSTAVVATGLVAPTASDITDAVTLILTIDGKAVSATLPSNNAGKTGLSWLPGYDYQYTVAVYGNELVVKSVSIVDWTVSDVNSTNPINVKP